ncbi:3-deoxy-D-manno-octulosonic acid kinase [Pseudomarimonas arenosa]|uniref:3-deoxy-D-manno-octulosonic acid kinase n=1 Tax=Pseudomarimonas arenosa TaxID=2774145 RepID=A0AAW3ZLG7_9GAMM|nr:3-deoxy-D-manno-octulosonic acid kinase [Pseudomarimonas arenosa]MBD8526032.1 3-deoxy-D-manno-octulosonic acid kinase [Pseudomarimonas arenosa]
MCADKTDITHSVDRNAGLLFDRCLLPRAVFEMLSPDYWQAQAEHARGGRGAVWMVQGEFGTAVLRHYRRGGMAARVSRDTYLWRGASRTRSFAEFRLLLRLRELGLPVPRPILAGYRRRGLFGYSADLLMSRIEQACSLAELLRGDQIAADAMHNLGDTLARFHQAGVDHADLNAHNLLRDSTGRWWVIDFDRGRLRSPHSGWIDQRLQRLRRSMCKVRGDDRAGADQAWNELRAAHDRAAPEFASAALG